MRRETRRGGEKTEEKKNTSKETGRPRKSLCVQVKMLPSMAMYLEKSTSSSEDATFDGDVLGKVYEFK